MSINSRLRRGACTALATLFCTFVVPAAVVVTSAGWMTGCGLGNRGGPSNVAQGLRYESGNADYDQFFAELHDAQVLLARAPDSIQSTRDRLGRKIGAPEGADAALLGEEVDNKMQEMKQRGTTFELTVDGLDTNEPDVVMAAIGPLSPQDKQVAKAVERAASKAADLVSKMRAAKRKSEDLKTQAAALEPAVDNAFRQDGPTKRSEVRENLRDAQRLLPLMVERAEKVEQAAKALLDELESKSNTAESTPAPPPAPPADAGAPGADEAPPAPAPAARPRKPAGATPKPEAAPKPGPEPDKPTPPPSADDFEP